MNEFPVYTAAAPPPPTTTGGISAAHLRRTDRLASRARRTGRDWPKVEIGRGARFVYSPEKRGAKGFGGTFGGASKTRLYKTGKIRNLALPV